MKKNSVLTGMAIIAALALSLAGCGGGGSGGGPGTTTGALETGGGGLSLAALQEEGGAAGDFSLAVAINDANEVIGYAETTAGSVFSAARWSVNVAGNAVSTPASLKPLGVNTFSAAFGVDGAGNAVGVSSKGTLRVAVLWPTNVAEPVELTGLAPDRASAAYGISPDGRFIVGEAQDSGRLNRAVVWEVTGGNVGPASLLPVPAGSEFSSASGVNDDGWIVGEIEDAELKILAALWRPGATGYEFQELRGGGEVSSAAYAVTNMGQIIGESETAAGIYAPVIWEEKTENNVTEFKRTDLGTEGGATGGNDFGLISGWQGGTSPRATVWDSADLSAQALYATDSQAYDINNDNLVVGRLGSKGFIKRAN